MPGPDSFNSQGQILPNGIATNFDGNPNTVGTFSLTYNEPTVMQISVTSGTSPAGDPALQTNPSATSASQVTGLFTMWFDANGNGGVDLNAPTVGGGTQRELLNVAYDETDPTVAAGEIQSWLRNFAAVPANTATGFAGSNATAATINAIGPGTFVVNFGVNGLDQSSLLQYLSPASNALATNTLSGFLPAVSVTTLDKPFVMNNIPVSQTDPNQTAQAIAYAFEQQVDSFSTGVAPFSFPTPERAGSSQDTSEAPYTAPIYTNVGATSSIATPVTGWNPTVQVQAVTNPDGTLSYSQFDVTFTGVSGATVEQAMLVSNTVDENQIPIDPSQSQVTILKQSGNEFEVDQPQASNLFNQNQQPLNSDQPAVAMDGSGDFVISWRAQVPQEVAPKNVTDIYFRMYQPVGVVGSYNQGAIVAGSVTSDVSGEPFTGVRLIMDPTVAQVQQLTFTSTAGPTLNNEYFDLHLGTVTTADIQFNTSNLAGTAVAIQAALVSEGYAGATVAYNAPPVPNPNQTVFQFTVRFGGVDTGIDEPPITYSPSTTNPPLQAMMVSSNITTNQYTDVVGDPYTRLANVNYTNAQFQPAVAMDPYGNFIVAWASQGQDASYFNNVTMQRFNNVGQVVSNAVTVDNQTQNIDFAPDIALGADGNSVVTWSDTSDPAYLTDQNYTSTVYIRAFNAQSGPMWNQLEVDIPSSTTGANYGEYSTVAMDGKDNTVVSWESYTDTDPGIQSNGAAPTSQGIYGEEFQIESAGKPLAQPATLRDTFRVNSYSTDTTSAAVWPYEQTAANVQMDISGNIAVTYQGNGPAVSTNISIPATFFQSYFAVNPDTKVMANKDLLPYFDPFPSQKSTNAEAGDPLGGALSSGLPGVTQPQGTGSTAFPGTVIYQDFTNNYDTAVNNNNNANYNVDTAIDQVLFDAEYPQVVNPASTLTAATPEQLGRLRAILNSVAGLLRGSSNGVLMTQVDSNTQAATATYSDDVVSSQRQGQDQRYYIIVPTGTIQGSFQLQIQVGPFAQVPGSVSQQAVTVTTGTINIPELQGDAQPPSISTPGSAVIDTVQTQQNIANAIDAAMGQIWPGQYSTTQGAVNIRELTQQEILDRDPGNATTPNATTAWELPPAVLEALGLPVNTSGIPTSYDMTPYITAEAPSPTTIPIQPGGDC